LNLPGVPPSLAHEGRFPNRPFIRRLGNRLSEYFVYQ